MSTDVQTGVSTGVEAGSSATGSGFGRRGGSAGSGTGVLALDDGRERALVGRGCAERLRRLASSSCRRSKSSFFSSRCRDTLRNGRAADLDDAASTGFCRIEVEGGTSVTCQAATEHREIELIFNSDSSKSNAKIYE